MAPDMLMRVFRSATGDDVATELVAPPRGAFAVRTASSLDPGSRQFSTFFFPRCSLVGRSLIIQPANDRLSSTAGVMSSERPPVASHARLSCADGYIRRVDTAKRWRKRMKEGEGYYTYIYISELGS